MLTAFILNLREGVEIALVVAVILAYLAKTGRQDLFRRIWLGVGMAVILCLAAGGLLVGVLSADRQEHFQAIVEGSTMMVAVVVLTSMIFWMRKAGAGLTRELRSRVESVVQAGNLWPLTLLSFVSVLREGVEAVLFTLAAAQTAAPAQVAAGALGGLLVAALFGLALYRGSRRLNLKAFFYWTGLTLIVVCAGLLAGAISQFQELGWIPPLVQSVWDSSRILSDESLTGGILHSLLGYDAAPSLMQILIYWGYLAAALTAFLRPLRTATAAGAPRASQPGSARGRTPA